MRYPNAVRPWQNVLDILTAYILIPINQKNRKNNFESWNIGPNIRENVVKVIELINKISNHLDHKIKTKTKKTKHKEKKILLLNSEKIRKKIRWKNIYNIDDTVRQLSEWYKIYLNGDKKNLKLFSEKLVKQTIDYIS